MIGRALVSAGESWVEDEAYRLGAALSFYAIFSLFPLLLLCATIVGIALGNDHSSHERLLDFVLSGGMRSEQLRGLLSDTLDDMQKQSAARGVGAAIGACGLVLGASGVFGELDTALNRVWRVKTPPLKGFKAIAIGLLHDKLLSFALVAFACLAVIVTLVASLLVSTLGSRIGDHFFATEMVTLASPLAMAGVVLAMTTALFVILPQKKIKTTDALAGAIVTSLLLLVLRFAFRLYLSIFTGYAAYGAVGAVLALVMWIYLASVFLLYGAEFSRAWHEARV